MSMLQLETIDLKKILYQIERKKFNYHVKSPISLEYSSGPMIYSEIYLNVITIWLMGERINTQFMLLLAICQVLYVICNIGSDTVHSLDYEEKYNFGTMLGFRFHLIFVAFFLGFNFLLLNGYLDKMYYLALFLVIMSDKALEAFARCCEAEFARKDKQIRNMPSIIYRQFFPLAVYALMLIFTRDILIAYGFSVIVKLPFVFFFDFFVINHKKKIHWRYQPHMTAKILADALPDFIPSISCSLLLYVPRIVLGLTMGGKYLSCYQECFILAQIIFQLIYLLVRPKINNIKKMWSEGKYEICKKNIVTFTAAIGFITMVSVILLSMLGPGLLRILFSDAFEGSNYVLYWFAAALGLRLLNMEMYFVLVIRNAGVLAAIIRTACAVMIIVVSVQLIPGSKIITSAAIYAIGRATECILLCLCAGIRKLGVSHK